MNIPDNISIDQLNDLIKQTSHLGKQPVTAQEFKPIATTLIEKLEDIYKDLDALVPDNVMHNRWQWVERSKRNLRVSIRTLEKSRKT